MTVIACKDPRNFMDDLVRSRSGQLLREELGRRWPETADRLSTIVRHALLPAGKLIRPIMALECAEAVGGSAADVLPAALGVEYLHTATLVHDDIIDADEMRRGRPAVQFLYGIPDAIVTGDHMIFAAFNSIVECGPAGVPREVVVSAAGALATAGSDLCRGQVLEAQLVGDLHSGVASYLEMIRLKTGALFRATCHIGAALGGASPALTRQLAGYGENLGIAFQIRDDLLDYTAPAEMVGDSTSDLANGRPTLPILLAYEMGTAADRRRLTTALRRRSADRAQLDKVHALLRDTGALERCRQQVAAYTRQALDCLSALESSPSADVLAAMAQWVEAPEC
jgi:geranylgeranyl diphosphate synthase type I